MLPMYTPRALVSGRRFSRIGRLLAPLLAALLLAAPLDAQYTMTGGWDSGRSLVSRQDLEDLVARLEAGTANVSGADARREADFVRARLAAGDFQAGDQIELTIEGEPDLSSTYVVEEGRRITLPAIGAVSLDGVLRSELQQHLTTELGRYIRDPVVRARSLARVAVLGAVGAPGFYVVAADLVFSDAIMQAGGPAGNARLEATEVQRGNTTILNGSAIQAAFAQGQTLDRMGVRSGDQIVVPEGRTGIGTFTVVQMVITTVTAILSVIRFL